MSSELSELWKPVQTKQDWDEIEECLSVTNPIKMKIDNYDVRLHLLRVKSKLRIILFINGRYDPLFWMKGENSEIPQKFFCPKEKYFYTEKERKGAVRHLGKQKAKELGCFDKLKYIQYDWETFSSLRRHLQKNCTVIAVCRANLSPLLSIGGILEADKWLKR